MAESETKPTPEPDKVPENASKHYVWTGADGRTIGYTAAAEMVDIYDDKGTVMAHQFCLSYVSDDDEKDDRPVTFLWNGGPGGSSSMVCVGGMGPVRVPTDGLKPVGNTCPVEDNPYTLLKESDLVFIDAPGTGYSRVATGYDSKKLWSVDGDADAMARTIIAWMDDHDAWNRPHYLYGESYGTTRGAVVYRLLGERGVGVDGVVEQSAILDFAVMLPGDDDYYAGMFPVLAATAQSAGVTGQGVDPEEWFGKAMEFVDRTLISALTMAGNLPADEMEAVAGQMSEFIGLPTAFILDHKLRIELHEFRAHFQRENGLTWGRYDTRYTEAAYLPIQGNLEFFEAEDPSYDAIQVAYNEVYQKLLRDMGFKGYPNYLGLSMEVNEAWNWSHAMPGVGSAPMPNVAYDLATALRRNPTSHVLFIGGRHDGATPYWNVIHDVAKLYLPENLSRQVHWLETSGGHMLYTDLGALEATDAALKEFYDLRHGA